MTNKTKFNKLPIHNLHLNMNNVKAIPKPYNKPRPSPSPIPNSTLVLF